MKASRHSSIHSLATALVFLAAAAAFAGGGLYDESVTGDLAGPGDTPTSLGELSLGVCTVDGTMGGTPVDADIFTFAVPAGSWLTSIDVMQFDVPSGSFGSGWFLSAGAGNTMDTTLGGSFDWTLVSDPGSFFVDHLPAGPGEYVVWLQETAGGVVDYQLGFTTVPEPTSLSLVFLGLIFGLVRRPGFRQNASL